MLQSQFKLPSIRMCGGGCRKEQSVSALFALIQILLVFANCLSGML